MHWIESHTVERWSRRRCRQPGRRLILAKALACLWSQGADRQANGAVAGAPTKRCVWPCRHLPPARMRFWLRSPSGIRKHQSLRL